ncbi:hypothetical protein BS78_09G107600 [Paspalum vaginatum]|nr:hypothetical protein BS78_09G107600 [Paspalum vaginatum]
MKAHLVNGDLLHRDAPPCRSPISIIWWRICRAAKDRHINRLLATIIAMEVFPRGFLIPSPRWRGDPACQEELIDWFMSNEDPLARAIIMLLADGLDAMYS